MKKKLLVSKATVFLGMSLSVLVLYLSISNVTLAEAEESTNSRMSAKEIMARVDSRDEGDSFKASSTMILIDKRERQRVRQLQQFSKDYDAQTKSMAYFVTPSDLKDTVYTSYNWNDSVKDDDSWLYLPALRKLRRIASEDQSGAFLGSDFTYADINGFEFDWYDYRLVSESEILEGHDCWVIEYQAKPDLSEKVLKSTGDLKTKVWIRKDIFMLVKSIIWKEKDRVKYYMASDIEKIENIWTAKKMQMVTTKKGKRIHSSVFVINNIDYNISLSDELFSAENMQRVGTLL